MLTLKVRNVNQALHEGVRVLRDVGIKRDSRNGPTIEVGEPVTTQYIVPEERVLFSRLRNANPFFHLFESLWMLAGRNDISFVASFVPRMKEFSDDGEVDHGAYGFRWREWYGFDQLTAITDLLRKDPATRRAVLQMWSPCGDLVASEGAGGLAGKDIPCNTAVYFKQRDGALHMTVTNRSNDMLWGAYGANVVHMSVLQEYIANKAGLALGYYHQVSDSFHVYTEGPGGDLWKRVKDIPEAWDDPYTQENIRPFPLGAADPEWDNDLTHFFVEWDTGADPGLATYHTRWWKEVAIPLWRAWRSKDGHILEQCAALDWRKAGMDWLARREAAKEAK